MEQPITINKYLSEKSDEILKKCDDAIKNGIKIHFNSPVGSGKTTMAIEIMECNPDKNFVVLFPQISITEQVKVKLVAKGLDAVIVNSRTIEKAIADNKSTIKNRIMLSTVDSAYKLIEEINFTGKDTVVIMDETHTYLQAPREKHTATMQAILDKEFPVIGFSATPSSWVSKFLLEIDNEIEFQFKKDRKQEVYQTTVKKGLLRTVAYEITEDFKGPVVVFMETKRHQEQLRSLITEYNSSINVCILNADTKSKTEWQYLMNNDSLPTNFDVFLINSVAQAGVNITSQDIQQVYLLDCFDPFGFAQYLGRCRNYKRSYHYYNSPYGKQLEAFDSNEIQERIDFVTEVLASDNKQIQQLLKRLKPMISDQVYLNNKNILTADKCKIAYSVYEKLRGLSGDDLILVTESLFPDIEFQCLPELDGIVVTPAGSQQKSRKTAQTRLREYIESDHDLINDLAVKMNFNYSESNMVDTINKHFGSKGLKTLQEREDKLREIHELGKKAQITPKRLIEINSLFRQSHNHEGVLQELMSLNGNKFNHINSAIKFFEGTTPAKIKTLMENIYHQKGELLTALEWKKLLKQDVQNPTNSSILIDNLYKFCLHTTRSNGKLRLDKINETIEDYLETYDFKHLVYYQGKLSPK
ncbi:DEAD/DEAH box helicase family protein [Maribellus sediminis]|uniref:DEAD/DEAH box helicase family protein n=1 Tax=Maribellus sediminis TaxID=2696285 RepID=UPI00143150F6|nr:DEAD/DEAH box helicase family protein [Maribellus sediminis]